MEGCTRMKRPIGVTLLALGAGLAGLYEIWRTLVFLGIVYFNFVGKDVSFNSPQWGQAIWAVLLAAIWFWVAEGFWNIRAYAWQFGIFISIFTVIFGFFALLGGAGTMESEFIGWLLAIRDLHVPQLPGRPRRVHGARAVDADPGAARCCREGTGRAAGRRPGHATGRRPRLRLRRRRRGSPAPPARAPSIGRLRGVAAETVSPNRSRSASRGPASSFPGSRRSPPAEGGRGRAAASVGRASVASSHVDVGLRAEPGPLALGERDVAAGVEVDRRVRVSSPSSTAHASR